MIQIRAPNGEVVNFPDGTSDDVIVNAMRQTYGGPQEAKPDTRYNPNASVPLDMAKQAAAGVAQAGESIATTPAHLANLVGRGVQYGLDKLGFQSDPVALENQAKLKELATQARGGDSIVDQYLPRPETPQGEAARYVTNYGTQMLTMPGKLGVNAVGGVTAGLGGYAGNEMGGPVGELVGATLGGVGGLRAAETLSGRARAAFQPTNAQLKAATDAGYADIARKGNSKYVPQSTLDALAYDAATKLKMEGPRPNAAPQVYQSIERIRTPAFEGVPDVNDLVTAQKDLKSFFKTKAARADKAGAAKVLPLVEDAIKERSPEIAAALKQTDKDYAIRRASEALTKKITEAEMAGQSKYSGLGTGDAIRNRVEQFLKSNDARYISDSARTALEEVAKGSATEKTLRFVAKALGGGSGLGFLTAAGIGGAGAYTGNPYLLAAAPLGFGARLASNALTKNQAKLASALLRSESSLGQNAAVRMIPQLTAAQKRALAAALISRSPALQPTY